MKDVVRIRQNGMVAIVCVWENDIKVLKNGGFFIDLICITSCDKLDLAWEM